MSLSRAEKLLAAMTVSERRALETSLRSLKRGSLYSLYQILSKGLRRNIPFDKESAFGELFDRPYSLREDYLIRNELRLLTNHLYDFIAEHEYRREFDANEGMRDVMLARGLLERRLFAEFEGMIDKCWRKALDRLDYLTAARLKDLEYRYLIFHNEISPEVMKQAHEVMGQQLLDLKRVYRTDVAVNQHNSVVCEENLRLMKQPVKHTAIATDTDFNGSDTPYILFYESVSRAYQTSGDERLGHARQAVERILQIAELFPSHALLGLAVLASNCFAEGRYAEARESFEQCLAFATAHALTPRVDVVFNYASTLMRFGEYQMTLDLFDAHRTALESEPKVRFRCECIRCFCHIFLGDPASALAAIPPNITQRPESEYQYFRFLYLIIPYLNDDLESALRECRNFTDYFNRHKGELIFPESKEVVGLFRRFYTVVADATDRAQLRSGLAPISADLEALMAIQSDTTVGLYLVWLRGEIDEKMG